MSSIPDRQLDLFYQLIHSKPFLDVPSLEIPDSQDSS